MKKIIAIVSALVLVITMFAACSGNTETDATKDVEKTDSALENEQTDSFAGKTLTMGSSCDFPPYEYIGENGEYIGIDVEIATAVCEKLGATLEVKDMDFNGIIAAVEAGAVDFGMSGMTITDARKESVDFSTPYEVASQKILTKEGSDIQAVEDMEGKTIAVQTGTTGDTLATEDFGQDCVKQYTKYSLAVAALVNDQADCVVLDSAVAEEFAALNEGLVVVNADYGKEEYGVAFSKDNTALSAAFDEALNELLEDGTVDAILAKYKDSDETEDAAEETAAEEAIETTVEAAA